MGSSQLGTTDMLSLPKGGGAVSGLGETFQPDLHTGTGNFTVPITLTAGRNGLTPQLRLGFSTGAGNGPFGLGWNLSVPGIARRTEKGVPRYGADDVFVLSGTEDLVETARDAQAGTTHYRPRTEGLFARITHHASSDGGHWIVQTKDGLSSVYGSPRQAPTAATDPRAVIADPENASHIFAWRLTETSDPLGNRIVYDYRRDNGPADRIESRQLYLRRIRYVDLPERGPDTFLLSVDFFYDDEAAPVGLSPEYPTALRPDPFSDCRAGFEICTRRRCKWIVVNSHADPARVIPVRAYELVYLDEQPAVELPANRASLLARINMVGFDDAGQPQRELPPLDFGYSRFDPRQRSFTALAGRALPLTSLANPDLELVDLFGNGLPDILELGAAGARYWRNLGDGRFDLPRPFAAAPAAWRLADAGVQLLDANGDGRADLLVTTGDSAGYWPLDFRGGFSPRSYRRYAQAPSFNLEDPEVRLLDLTGDGVTDVLRSGSSFECYFNDPVQGFTPERTARIPRGRPQDFPDVSFSDLRVKLADLNGDHLLDIALVHQGRVDYWPNLGHGRFGPRRSMLLPTGDGGLPFQFDPARVLLGDVDGDGLADLLYVDDRSVTLWINRAGNGWSAPIRIQGTPAVDDLATARLIDLNGSGVAGLLWTRDAGGDGAARHYFLDFTGGTKPYLLNRMDNHMGAVTEVRYAPSTHFYLRDERNARTRWRTTLPFPVQVVEGVTVRDQISGGTMSTEYRYHHGYWDGVEREFRGFGLVEQTDTEVFDGYAGRGLPGDAATMARLLAQRSYSPPILTRSWFHQGPVDPPDDALWSAPAPHDEYWPQDGALLGGLWQVDALVATLPPTARREAQRSLRGSALRGEIYALDGSSLQDRPYSVTEYAYGLTEIAPLGAQGGRQRIFFPHQLAQRTTRWERGDDPATRIDITADHDDFGQPLRQLSIACPRGWRGLTSQPAEPYLATLSATVFAAPPAAGPFIADRVVRTRAYELTGSSLLTVDHLWSTTEAAGLAKRLFAETLNYYDGPAFDGLASGALGAYGVLVRSESLVLTEDLPANAYGAAVPPWLDATTPFNAGGDYPQGFAAGLAAHAGYHHRTADADAAGGWYVQTTRIRHDFQDPAPPAAPRGLLLAQRDPLGHETRISYDALRLLPAVVTGPTGLSVRADYNLRVFQPRQITDPNGNRAEVLFSPSGFVTDTFVRGKAGLQEGDVSVPSISLRYDLRAFLERAQPVHVRTLRRVRHDSDQNDAQTIETREYSDGFGRLLQTRTQGEAVRFGDPQRGGVLPADQAAALESSVVGRLDVDEAAPNVIVSGWQVYDNKGRVVEQYEPFFDTGWDYDAPADAALGQTLRMFYDAPGRVVRTILPDGAVRLVVHGVPHDLADPPQSPLDSARFRPSPWETTSYDANDNAGRTHPGIAPHDSYRHHYDTPSSTVVDALGRTTLSTARHRGPPVANGDLPPLQALVTRSHYDIQGNLVGIHDSLGRLAFTYQYDLAGHPLHTHSIDAGPCWTAWDAAGNGIERRDAKGALQLQAYDALHRAARVWARDAQGEMLTLRQRLAYGDDAAFAATAAAANLLGRLVRHDDEAGRVELAACDFKGNPLRTSRRVLSDAFLLAPYRAELAMPAAQRSWALPAPRVDWDDVAADAALAPALTTRSAYDALNRIVWSDYPQAANGDRYRLQLTYNRAGALESVTLLGPLDVNDQGPAQTFVQHLAYDAKGQRTLVAYGNGILTRYAYDPLSLRLARLRTERWGPDTATPANPYRYLLRDAPLQDIAYDHDLVGNLLSLRDLTPGCGVHNHPDALLQTGELRRLLSSGDALLRRFEYDPLYRLTSATGREAVNIASPRPWADLQRDGYGSGAHGTADQDNAPHLTAPYREDYDYDAAGNMLATQHSRYIGGGGWQAAWSRRFGMDGRTPDAWRAEVAQHTTGVWGNPASNRLTHVEDRGSGAPGVAVAQSHWYDANGNTTRERIERAFEWDHKDHMKSFRNQIGSSRPTTYALYLYDAAGVRVKKLVVTGGATYRTTTYVAASFEHHTEQQLSGGGLTENCSLHVMDGKSRIAIARVGPAFADDGAAAHDVQYHLGDHLSSACIVVADDGHWINREEFFPFGETSLGSFGRKRFRFIAAERDEASGFSMQGARNYAPWLARWVHCDPTGPGGGIGLYLYAHDSPMVLADSSGHVPMEKVVQSRFESILSKYGWAYAPAPMCSVGGIPAIPDILAQPPGSKTFEWFELKRDEPNLRGSLSKYNGNQDDYIPPLKNGARPVARGGKYLSNLPLKPGDQFDQNYSEWWAAREDEFENYVRERTPGYSKPATYVPPMVRRAGAYMQSLPRRLKSGFAEGGGVLIASMLIGIATNASAETATRDEAEGILQMAPDIERALMRDPSKGVMIRSTFWQGEMPESYTATEYRISLYLDGYSSPEQAREAFDNLKTWNGTDETRTYLNKKVFNTYHWIPSIDSRTVAAPEAR